MTFRITLIFIILSSILGFSQQNTEKDYYENGKLKSEITFENGVRTGEAKFYYDNGNIKAEMNYVNGRVDGLVKQYSETGNLSEMFTIENGKRQGPTTLFDEKGVYLKDIMFVDGKRVVEEPVYFAENNNEKKDETIQPEKKEEKKPDKKRGIDILLPPEIEEIPEDDPAYYLTSEVMPEPEGGIERIERKIIYPTLAREEKIEGSVIVRAFIDEYGTVTKAEVVQGIGYGCDEAAYLAVYFAKFNPGLIRGKPVRVQTTLSVQFKLN